jgi:hypothetical protein
MLLASAIDNIDVSISGLISFLLEKKSLIDPSTVLFLLNRFFLVTSETLFLYFLSSYSYAVHQAINHKATVMREF